jgi:ferric-dicitrate binding protein FerR (iron transport regulator)
MKRFGWFIFILSVFIWMEGSLFADDYAGKITSVHGKVTVRMPGWDNVSTLKAGDRFPMGGELKTEKNARAQLIFTDGSFVRILPGTTLRVNQYSYSPTDRRSSVIIKMINGRARFVVFDRQRGAGSRFVVETKHTSLSIGITDLFVTVSPAETEVAVIGGAINVTNNNHLVVGTVRLGVNTRTILKEWTPPSMPAAIPYKERRKYVKETDFF